MKIKFFQFHPHTLFSNGGGEAIFKNVISELKHIGVDVSIYDIQSRNSSGFEIFHLFGSNNSVSEIYQPIVLAGKKLVVSAIDYSDMNFFKLKLYKFFQKYYIFPNVYKYRQKLFSASSIIIANSKPEKTFLLDYFDIDKNKIVVIPVGVSSKFYNNKTKSFVEKYNLKKYILCVGRINSRKGQIKVINSLRSLSINIVFIGESDPSEPVYFKKFEELVKTTEGIYWVGQLKHDSDLLISAYSNALLHVLPSNPPEFPGISSMEAGLAGTKVVTTYTDALGDTFKDYAYYCKSTEESILHTVNDALKAEDNKILSNHLYNNFVWEKLIEKYVLEYKKLVK